MACSQTNQRSPGYLRLEYVHVSQALRHSTRARLLAGVDPGDGPLMQATADVWGGLLADCLPPTFHVDGYSVLRADGSLIYSGSLTSAYLGAHGSAVGAEDFRSRTLTITGRGFPSATGICSGEELIRFYVGSGYQFTAGEKVLQRTSDSALDALCTFLDSNNVIWADNYGFKARCRGELPVQFNAYTQKAAGT